MVLRAKRHITVQINIRIVRLFALYFILAFMCTPSSLGRFAVGSS